MIIDGKKIADNLCKELSKEIAYLKKEYNLNPCLKVVLVGNNSASRVYVRNKQKKAESLGIDSETIILSDNISESELIKKISELNNDKSINGILVQLPLPNHIQASRVINSINIEKDVDGFHNENVGKLIKGEKNCFIPCTPCGVLHLIKSVEKDLSGKNAVVIGRSSIVGKPMFHLLLQENCTVTILHSHSRNISDYCLKADILVAAVGKPKFIQPEWVKNNSIVIDVGINSVENKLVGDVDFEKIKEKAKAITPVPGGVGPMTIAFLMINTIIAACSQNKIILRAFFEKIF